MGRSRCPAGGLAKILEEYRSRVVVHRAGARHLVDPGRLWDASRRALGDLAIQYGEPRGIPEKYLFEGEPEFEGERVRVVETPGHAPHHQSYIYRDILFVGEAAGVHIPLIEDFYLRPATPPKFIYEHLDSSLKNLIRLISRDTAICFSHYGLEFEGRRLLDIARRQLRLWVDVATEKYMDW
jgi:glyoxylase-like metal-dependent hydrolase (beta-lactamase superfamily II)